VTYCDNNRVRRISRADGVQQFYGGIFAEFADELRELFGIG